METANIDQSKKYDVVGIGNAIMDFLIEVDDNILAELNLPKGQFRGIDNEEMKNIFAKFEKHQFKRVPGGSAANILSGIAMMGGKSVFSGKVGAGETGAYYAQAMQESGVEPILAKSNAKTGRLIGFITPDTERTFACNPGAALEFNKDELPEDQIKNSKILHIEGYLFHKPALFEAAMKAISIAKENNILISMDINDATIVKNNFDTIRSLVKNHVDIVFANEMEAEAFTGKSDPEEAVEALSEFAPIAIVKNGSKGSLIKHNGQIINIPCFKANAIDTTGAGDMYAAGFMYGFCKGYDLKKCGTIGSFAAARVVEQIGARYEGDLKQEIQEVLKESKDEHNNQEC